jgi:hypothetical protein
MNEEPVNGLKQVAEPFRRAAAGEPPAAVDAAVRANARAALRRRRASAWTLPAALAATALIAFSFIVQVQRDATAPPEDAVAGADEPATAARLQESAPAPSTPTGTAEANRLGAGRSALPAAAPSEASQALAADPAAPDTPERWLGRIEALEAAGRREEAEAERARLEAAHPGWLAEHAATRD